MSKYSINFEKVLREPARKVFENDGVIEVFDSLRTAMEKITAGRLDITREIGYLSELGQEWRFRLKNTAMPSAATTLFRAHVPLSGPTYLDLGGQNMERCESPAAVAEALERFLEQPEIQSTIAYLGKAY